ncbi:MAG: Gfo/Idh/MocA family oxidoreductase [Planctomycetota bacterium]
MTRPLRFAIIGCGGVAATHAKALSQLSDTSLAGCIDIDPKKSLAFAGEWGCEVIDSFPMNLRQLEIDVAIVCTPSGRHFESSAAVAEQGIHVLVEKPLETTVAKCDSLIKVCEEAGVMLGTVFPSRFRSSYRNMKEAIDNRKFGRIGMVHANVPWYRDNKYFADVPWRGTLDLDGGGCLMNQGIHVVDLMTWMFGKPISVSCAKSRISHEIEGEDSIAVLMRFPNETIGTLNVTTIANPGFPRSIQVWGSEGCGTATDTRFKVGEISAKSILDNDERAGASAHANPLSLDAQFHRLAISDFVRAVRGRTRLCVTPIDGRDAVEIVEAAYKSASTGRAIHL